MKRLSKLIKVILLSLGYVGIYYGATFLVQLIYLLWQKSLVGTSLSEIEINITNNSYALSVIASVLSFWIYLVIGKVRKCSLEEIIENRKKPPVISAMAVCLAVGMRFLVTAYYSFSQNIEILKKSIDEASAITPELTGMTSLVITLFSVVVIAPLFEELLFRGIIMRDFMKIMRPWAAITLQAVFFGAAHAVLFQSIFAFAVGIILGVVYYKTHSLKTVAICHGAFNISVILAQNELGATESIIMTVIGLVITVFALTYIIANSKEQ